MNDFSEGIYRVCTPIGCRRKNFKKNLLFDNSRSLIDKQTEKYAEKN